MRAKVNPGIRRIQCDYPADIANNFVFTAEQRNETPTKLLSQFMLDYVSKYRDEESFTKQQQIENQKFFVSKLEIQERAKSISSLAEYEDYESKALTWLKAVQDEHTRIRDLPTKHFEFLKEKDLQKYAVKEITN